MKWNIANDADGTPEEILADLAWASLIDHAAKQLRFDLAGAGGASWMRVSGLDLRDWPSDHNKAEGFRYAATALREIDKAIGREDACSLECPASCFAAAVAARRLFRESLENVRPLRGGCRLDPSVCRSAYVAKLIAITKWMLEAFGFSRIVAWGSVDD